MATTSSQPPKRGLHGLIVDDALMDGFIASCILRQEGYEVTLAKSGMEAVEAVTKRDFDFVLMDMRMPNMDGFEATRRIRQIEGSNGQVLIMALTAMDLREQDPQFINAGMDGVMSKPIDPDALHIKLSCLKQPKTEPIKQLEFTHKPLSQDNKLMQVQTRVERRKPINSLKDELVIKRPYWADFSMESAFWTALNEICSTKRITTNQFVEDSVRRYPEMSKASAVQLGLRFCRKFLRWSRSVREARIVYAASE